MATILLEAGGKKEKHRTSGPGEERRIAGLENSPATHKNVIPMALETSGAWGEKSWTGEEEKGEGKREMSGTELTSPKLSPRRPTHGGTEHAGGTLKSG